MACRSTPLFCSSLKRIVTWAAAASNPARFCGRKQELGKKLGQSHLASFHGGKCLNLPGTPHSGRRNVTLASAQVVRCSGSEQSLLFYRKGGVAFATKWLKLVSCRRMNMDGCRLPIRDDWSQALRSIDQDVEICHCLNVEIRS